MSNILCVIPARIGSTRLARKPLLDLAGKPMIQRTYEAALTCPAFTNVVVATDSDEIADVIKAGQVIGKQKIEGVAHVWHEGLQIKPYHTVESKIGISGDKELVKIRRFVDLDRE